MALPWSVLAIALIFTQPSVSVPSPEVAGALRTSSPDRITSPTESAVDEALAGFRTGRAESIGHPFTGRLEQARRIPRYGVHHVLLPRTAHRGYVWALDELVDGLLWTAEALRRVDPASARLVVGNLSRRHGGDIHCSRSHNTGRDVDLGLYTLDRDGRSVPARYHRFGKDGRSLEAGGRYRFDVARNWQLIRSLLVNPWFEVQWLILNPHLERLLLEHARTIGEPTALIARADALIDLPAYANLHRNHLHVRIACPPGQPRCEPGETVPTPAHLASH